MKRTLLSLIVCFSVSCLSLKAGVDEVKTSLWVDGYLHEFNGRLEQLASHDSINVTKYSYPNGKRTETDFKINDSTLIRAIVDEIKSDVLETTLSSIRIEDDGTFRKTMNLISDSYPSMTLWIEEEEYGVIFGITFIANEANPFFMRSPQKKKRRFPVDSIVRMFCSRDLTKRIEEIYNQAVDTTAANARLFHIDSSKSTNPDVESMPEAAVVSPYRSRR